MAGCRGWDRDANVPFVRRFRSSCLVVHRWHLPYLCPIRETLILSLNQAVLFFFFFSFFKHVTLIHAAHGCALPRRHHSLNSACVVLCTIQPDGEPHASPILLPSCAPAYGMPSRTPTSAGAGRVGVKLCFTSQNFRQRGSVGKARFG